jgi:hypothetical protein
MIMAYPKPWTGTPPKYLVTGDKAFFLQDAVTAQNFGKVGVPLVPFSPDNMIWVLEKLDPQIEHPLTAFDPDPILDPEIVTGGNASTTSFLNTYDGGLANQGQFVDDPLDGGSA